MEILVNPQGSASAIPVAVVFVDTDLKLHLPSEHDNYQDLQGLVIAANLKGKTGELVGSYFEDSNCWYYLCGLDLEAADPREEFRRAVAAAVQALEKRFKDVGLQLSGRLATAEYVQAAAESAIMGASDDQPLKGDDAEKTALKRITLTVSGDTNEDALRLAAEQGRRLAEATLLARRLTNRPPNLLTPEHLVGEGRAIARRHGFHCTILGVDELTELGMHSILQVGAGSINPPRLLLIDSAPDSDQQPLALLGKGITFDSGGISIKPSKNMHHMRGDMGGAAVVLAAADALGHLGFKDRFVVAVPAAENMTGSNAQRPGDVITAYDGTTVEVLNTDAEGRLVLADALAYVREKYNPRFMIDLATLTGAIVIALGREAMGMMSNSQELEEMLKIAGDQTYERVWPLPMYSEYRKQLESSIADLQNIGGREAGSITAGWFLRSFVGDTPWVHLDIAGVSWVGSKRGYQPKGPTGAGVRLLVEALRNHLPDSFRGVAT